MKRDANIGCFWNTPLSPICQGFIRFGTQHTTTGTTVTPVKSNYDGHGTLVN